MRSTLGTDGSTEPVNSLADAPMKKMPSAFGDAPLADAGISPREPGLEGRAKPPPLLLPGLSSPSRVTDGKPALEYRIRFLNFNMGNNSSFSSLDDLHGPGGRGN